MALPTGDLTTREVETAKLLFVLCSGESFELVTEKYDNCENKADCHTCNKRDYVACNDHSDSLVFLAHSECKVYARLS